MKKSLFLFILTFFSFAFASYAGAASLSAVSSQSSYNVGDTFTVNVILNTQGSSVEGVDLRYLNYDPAFLELQDANASVSGIQIAQGSLMPNTVANSVSGGQILFSQAISGQSTYNGSGILATLTFRALQVGATSLSFDFTQGNTLDSNVASGGSDVLVSATGLSLSLTTPAPEPTPVGDPRMYISPATGTFGVGDEFVADIMIDTAGISADAADVVIRYDRSRLTVVDFDPNTPGIQIENGSVFENVQINNVDEARSTINFSKISNQSTNFSGSGVLARVHFKAISTGKPRVYFYFSRSSGRYTNIVSGGESVLREVEGAIYDIAYDNVPLMVYGGSPTGTVFSGRTQRISVETNKRARCRYSETPGSAYLDMRRSLRSSTGLYHYIDIRPTGTSPIMHYYIRCADLSGNMSSTDYPINFSVTAPPFFMVSTESSIRNYFNFDIFLSGSQNPIFSFRQRPTRDGKVTLPRDVVLNPGTYDIVVSSKNTLKKKQYGVAMLSASEIVFPKLLAGDVNEDGIVNSLDWSLLNANWFQRSRDYDINGDGVVNSIDWSFVKKNWLQSTN